MSHHVIGMDAVSFRYPDGTSALRDVTMEVCHGESLGIVGPNGAGKTTLTLLLTGALLPTSGRVYLGDLALKRSNRRNFHQRVGLVFQTPGDQLFMPTVYEDIAFGPRSRGLEEHDVEKRCLQGMELLGISDLRDRPTARLSEGEKKAVAIAGVLAMQPDILILDEPSAGLDPTSRRELIRFCRGFLHSRIVVSHDLDFVLETCDRCLLLDEGTVVRDSTAEDLLQDESLLHRHRLELPRSLAGLKTASGIAVNPRKLKES